MARPKPSAVPPTAFRRRSPTHSRADRKAAVASRPKVIGTDRVQVAFRFTLTRGARERLVARAIRAESIVAEPLEEG